MHDVPRTVYRFGDFELDAAGERLTRDGEEIALQPKVLQALLLFVQKPGQLVTKQELLAELWPDTFVTEEALTQIVHKLRRALGDSSGEPRFLQTVPRRGFRFLPAVTAQELSTVSEAVTGSVTSQPTIPAPAAESPTPGPPQPRRARGPALIGVVAVAIAAAAGLMLFAPRASNTLDPAALRVRRLTYFPERDQESDLSPDGRRLAFASTHDGGGLFRVFVMGTTGGTPVRLTQSQDEETSPRFSPDGQWIAFTRIGDGVSIWRAASLGGDERFVLAGAVHPDWSPDGSEIIAIRRLATGEETIVRAPVAGGAERDVLRWSGGIDDLNWSPDGSQIAFVSESAAWVLPAGGGTPRRVASGSVLSLNWSPDGKSLVCGADWSGRTNLWLVPLDGRSRKALTSGSGSDFSPSISTDWRTIVYTNERAQRHIWLAGPAGAPARRVEAKTTYLSISADPRANRVAFQDFDAEDAAAEDDMAVGVLDLDSASARMFGPGRVPAFSPDGRNLACIRKAAGAEGLWIVDLGNGQWRRIVEGACLEVRPAWSPDGRTVAFCRIRPDGGSGIAVADLASSEIRDLAAGDFRAPAYSPDGRWIAACGVTAEDGGVHAIDTRSGNIRRIASAQSFEAAPLWAPDSQSFQVLVDERTHPALAGFRLDGSSLGGPAPLDFAADPAFWGIFQIERLGDGTAVTLLTRIEGDIFLLESGP